MDQNPLYIPVVCGSVRENRRSIHVANFMSEQLKKSGLRSEVVDFVEIPLPFVNTAQEPSSLKGVYPDPNVQKWSNIAKQADAFVIVTPEYNHGYPGVLKNALDWLYDEFNRKPVGLVGVSSGLVGGVRAIEQLRPIMENFAMFSIRETILVRNAGKVFDDTGKLLDEDLLKQIPKFLDSLLVCAKAMKQVRNSM